VTRVRRATLVCLLAWTSPAWPQRPSDADAAAAIEQSRQKALAYTRSLPDFVCTEVIRRYVDRRERGEWTLTDRLTVRLSYFQHIEEHKLMLINDQPTNRDFSSLEGATGEGEFGGTLESIFDPQSQAAFRWESWKNVRKHRAAVYSYVVPLEHSRYLLVAGKPGEARQAVVGFHGVLEVDAESGEVLHFTYLADHIPKDLSVSYALTTVDYDFADVGGREYLLPARSETEMRGLNLSVRNQMEFRDYRKFSSDSTITFGPAK
jgi:hypothetical protein